MNCQHCGTRMPVEFCRCGDAIRVCDRCAAIRAEQNYQVLIRQTARRVADAADAMVLKKLREAKR